MIHLKKLTKGDFYESILKYSFSPIVKSEVYLGWSEQISNCNNYHKIHLIEYLFNDDVWLLFLIDPKHNHVTYTAIESIPLENIKSIADGAVLKLWLQLNNKYCLHASGILIDNELVLFMGPKGSGKSTTAAYFSNMGYPIWCDDYCILKHTDDGFFALPGQTKLKVKKDTIKGLSLIEENLIPMYLPVPEIEKKTSEISDFKSYYDSPNSKLTKTNKVKLRTIFILSERGNDEVKVQLLNKLNGLIPIINEIMLREIVNKEYLGYYFKETKHLLNHIQVFQINAINNLSQINTLVESVLSSIANEKYQ